MKRTQINISKDNKSLPGSPRFEYADTVVWHVAPFPESSPYHRSFGMCGVEAQSVVSNEPLTVDQCMYLITRIRSPYGLTFEPTGHRICIWLADNGCFMSIGFHTRNIWGSDVGELREWIDIALQDEFE
jgi:hypothetical protein